MTDLPQSADVVVVGGGIVGLSVALALAEAGAAPVLLEARSFGGAVTGGSLAAIGCHMNGEAEFALMQHACELWREFADTTETPIDYDRQGQIGFALTEADLEAARSWVETERALGGERELLDSDALRAIEPRLTGPLAGATFAPDTATVNPFLAVRAVLGAARREGARARERTPVARIQIASDRITGVALADGRQISSPNVVLACGPWSARLAADAGLAVPLRPRQAQCLASVRQPKGTVRRVVSACEGDAGVDSGYTQIQQAASGQILFNTVTAPKNSPPDAPDAVHEVPSGFVVESIDMLTRLFPCFETLPVLRSWVRFEAVSPDHRFLAGALPPEGLWITAGDNGSGYGRALMLGRVMEAAILGSERLSASLRSDAARLYAPDRFRLEAAA